MLRRVVERQDCAHRQTADDNSVARLAQETMLNLHALVPMLPGHRLELVGAAAVAGKLGHVHCMPSAGQALSNIAHLQGRAAKPMDKEDA